MSLVLLCGTPASGKTTRALELKSYLESKHGRQVILVNQQNLSLNKNQSYKDATAQKITRAKLKFETEKNLIGNNIVILDSLNYIKGWRYQMYCIAREMKATYCVIFCNSDVDKCRQFNENRKQKFDPDIFQDLTKRMETPQLKNRWDVPLFERRQNQGTPLEDIVQALLFQQKLSKDPISTSSEQKMVGVNYLEELDQIVQRICEQIMKQQSQRGIGVAFPVPDSSQKLLLTSNWTLIGLKKVKNQFLKVIKGKPIGLKDVGNSFVIFIKQADKRK